MLRALSRPLAALGDFWSGRFDPGELRVDVEKEVSRIFRYFLEGDPAERQRQRECPRRVLLVGRASLLHRCQTA
jgi:hypothetical protein